MAQIRMRADGLIGANHFDPQSVRNISDEVTTRWQNLVSIAEERHRLAQAAVRFFKTAEHVSLLHFQLPFPAMSSDLSAVCKHA
jgi:hypothetical protein